MKRSFAETRERTRIAELARRYQGKGYEVFAELRGYELPQQIRGIRPDLIAKKGDETIIVEVKTGDSMKKFKSAITQFAQYAKEVPGTRFKLVITNTEPLPSIDSKVETLQVELDTLREGLLADIKKASEQPRSGLILFLAVHLLVGLLARLAIKESIYVPLKEWNLAGLSHRLAEEKVISQAVLKFANKLYQQRNALIHKEDKEVLISPEEASDIYQKLNKLTGKWGGAIKMIEITCPVCYKAFNSYLNLAMHMVLKDRPGGEHIQYLERFLNKPFVEFGWKSDKKIATALRNYWVKHRQWPD